MQHYHKKWGTKKWNHLKRVTKNINLTPFIKKLSKSHDAIQGQKVHFTDPDSQLM